jgi:hypothetical protein
MRERMRFDLRSLFIVIAAAGVLFSQYLFIERELMPIAVNQLNSVEWRMVDRPTRGFVAVASVQALFVLGWFCWRVTANSSPP